MKHRGVRACTTAMVRATWAAACERLVSIALCGAAGGRGFVRCQDVRLNVSTPALLCPLDTRPDNAPSRGHQTASIDSLQGCVLAHNMAHEPSPLLYPRYGLHSPKREGAFGVEPCQASPTLVSGGLWSRSTMSTYCGGGLRVRGAIWKDSKERKARASRHGARCRGHPVEFRSARCRGVQGS